MLVENKQIQPQSQNQVSLRQTEQRIICSNVRCLSSGPVTSFCHQLIWCLGKLKGLDHIVHFHAISQIIITQKMLKRYSVVEMKMALFTQLPLSVNYNQAYLSKKNYVFVLYILLRRDKFINKFIHLYQCIFNISLEINTRLNVFQ